LRPTALTLRSAQRVEQINAFLDNVKLDLRAPAQAYIDAITKQLAMLEFYRNAVRFITITGKRLCCFAEGISTSLRQSAQFCFDAEQITAMAVQ